MDVAERLLELGEEEAGGGIALILRAVVGIEVALGLSLADLPALSLPLDPSHDVDQVTTELALFTKSRTSDHRLFWLTYWPFGYLSVCLSLQCIYCIGVLCEYWI